MKEGVFKMDIKINKLNAIEGFKNEIKALEERLSIYPEVKKIDTTTKLGFQMLVRITCIKANLKTLKNQLQKMEEA